MCVVHRWLDRLHAYRDAHPSNKSSGDRRRRRRLNLPTTATSSTENNSAITATTTTYWVTAIAFGQLVALLASSVNAASFTLEYHFGVDLPMFQMFFMYLILSSHIFFADSNPVKPLLQQSSQSRPPDLEPMDSLNDVHQQQQQQSLVATHSCKKASQLAAKTYDEPVTRWKKRLPQLRVPWYLYCGIAWLDVVSNYLTLLSLRYTSLTSTTLLGSLTVPSTMLVSRILLRKSFRRYHYMGVLLCLLGGTLTLWCDTSSSSAAVTPPSSLSPTAVVSAATNMATTSVMSNTSVPLHVSHDLLGDVLAMSAAILYGLTDTIAEYSIKHINRVEYLGMLGLFGTMWTALAFPWLEHVQLGAFFARGGETYDTGMAVIATMMWYIASLLGYYVSASLFLETSDATLLNLSLQAANLWSILVSVGMYRNIPPFGFYVAVVLVVSGVLVYEGCGRGRTLTETGTVKTVRFADAETIDEPNSQQQQHEAEDDEPLLQANHVPQYDAILEIAPPP